MLVEDLYISAVEQKYYHLSNLVHGCIILAGPLGGGRETTLALSKIVTYHNL